MTILRNMGLILVMCAVGFAQTQNLGLGTFSNDEGPILLAVDAGLVGRTIDSPYVMFVAYMASGEPGQSITVARKDVVMEYKGRVYRLPSVKELRRNYNGGSRDFSLYGHLGKEGLIASWVRHYRFPERAHFFPPVGSGLSLAVEEGSMFGFYGFRTPFYFKNPGFARGDKVIIRVRDKKNPRLVGECEIVLD